MTLEITTMFQHARRGHGKTFQVVAPSPVAPTSVRPPARVALLLALAATIDAAIDRGWLASQTEAARGLGLSSPRVSQLLALLQLAPDLQEQILFLEAIDGVEPITERDLRPITRVLDWSEQRAMWRELVVHATR